MEKANLNALTAFTTLDGSQIRELAGPAWSPVRHQSLAEVTVGDAVVIPPGTPHKLWNRGPEPLVLLCCCAPAYPDADTVMLDS